MAWRALARRALAPPDCSAAGHDMRGEGFAHGGVFSVVGRERLLFPLGALLGAAVVVLPAVASSEASPTISAVNSGGGYYHAWSPPAETIAAGGTVSFQNAGTSVPHGVVWESGPATPSCKGVPIGKGETSWKGTCVFSQPGTYKFYCPVHPTEMTGTITVNPSGTTTVTSTQTGPPAGTGPYTVPGPESAGGLGAPSGSPLAGSASSAIRLARVQHGDAVRGSVAVSRSGGGGRLEVDLLARRASLAAAPHAPLASAGRLARSSLPAGLVSFKVTLNARASHALRAHRRLALSVRIVIRPVHGQPVTVTRAVLLRP
jgi:plastocyanin